MTSLNNNLIHSKKERLLVNNNIARHITIQFNTDLVKSMSFLLLEMHSIYQSYHCSYLLGTKRCGFSLPIQWLMFYHSISQFPIQSNFFAANDVTINWPIYTLQWCLCIRWLYGILNIGQLTNQSLQVSNHNFSTLLY